MKKEEIISVIIPTYNRAPILEKTLESLLRVEDDGLPWELLVVDNNSSDRTAAVVARYRDRLPVRYLFEERQGKNAALNTALARAQGDLLVFTDDDVDPDPCWLRAIRRSSTDWPEAQLFGGRIVPCFPEGTPEWVTDASFSSFVFAIHLPNQLEGYYLDGVTPGGPNCWIRRKVIESGNLYDAEIGPKGRGRISGSELEFFTRLGRNGIHPVHVPSAVVHHRIQEYQTTVHYLLKRSFASGRGFVYINGSLDGPRLAGVPRYIFRHLAEYLLKGLWRYLRGDGKRGFEALMALSHRLGCIKEYRSRDAGAAGRLQSVSAP